jgi:hypothetical protein
MAKEWCKEIFISIMESSVDSEQALFFILLGWSIFFGLIVVGLTLCRVHIKKAQRRLEYLRIDIREQLIA